MSDETVINPKPCSCDEHNDSSEIIIQSLWNGRAYDVYIIFCNKCMEVEPVNVPHYINNSAELGQVMYKAWNQKDSNDLDKAIELLEACSEDLFLGFGDDVELEHRVDKFIKEVKS